MHMSRLLSGLQVPSDTAAAVGDSVQSRSGLSIPGVSPEVQVKLVVSAAAILLLVLIRRAVMEVVERRIEDATARYRWSKASGYAAFVVGLLVVFQVWFTALLSLGTFLGLLTAGLAIALKDLVAETEALSFAYSTQRSFPDSPPRTPPTGR